jgi:hypothetical protein
MYAKVSPGTRTTAQSNTTRLRQPLGIMCRFVFIAVFSPSSSQSTVAAGTGLHPRVETRAVLL